MSDDAGLKQPVLEKLGVGDQWVLKEPYTFYLDHCNIVLPAGFNYDLSSVPDAFHWTGIDEDSMGTIAPLIHDALYRYKGELPKEWVFPYSKFTRTDADRLYYRYALMCGTPSWKAKIAYNVVKNYWGVREMLGFSRKW